MKKKLNIKTLAKGMRVEDKAKLLFADRNKWAETSGREGLLTLEEEKALIADAQDLHQISELSRLSKLYNLATYIFLDIQTAYLHFKLSEGKVVTVLTGIVLVGEASDVFGYAKHDDKDLFSHYDYFDPPLKSNGYPMSKRSIVGQPNKLLQKVFMMTLEEAIKYKKQIFQWKYIESKAGLELLGDRVRKTISGFNKEVNEFINLDGYLSLTKMYADFSDKGLLKIKKLEEPKFLEAVKDMNKATRLARRDKKIAENEMEEIIHKSSD